MERFSFDLEQVYSFLFDVSVDKQISSIPVRFLWLLPLASHHCVTGCLSKIFGAFSEALGGISLSEAENTSKFARVINENNCEFTSRNIALRRVMIVYDLHSLTARYHNVGHADRRLPKFFETCRVKVRDFFSPKTLVQNTKLRRYLNFK